MKQVPEPRQRWTAILAGALALAATALFVAPANVQAGESSKTPAAPASTEAPAGPSGAELWATNCNRCHTYRAANEFTAPQWQTLMTHMRVRANLPASQARVIMKFLQDGAGR